MKTPIFGEPVPSLPPVEPTPLIPCRVCGHDPRIMSFYGVTKVACPHCYTATSEYKNSDDAIYAWQTGDVQPCADS